MDRIDHHSDKDLDLNEEGVIVSVSLGDERTLELRRRRDPRDVTRVRLPHGSMLILGPRTNGSFTHAILTKEGATRPRVSLTLRDVKTFKDGRTGWLFGKGVSVKSLREVRRWRMWEHGVCFAAFGILSSVGSDGIRRRRYRQQLAGNEGLNSLFFVGAFAAGVLGVRFMVNVARRRKEEREARDFFSRRSSSGTKY